MGDFVVITSGPYHRTPSARRDSLKWANNDTKLSTKYLELAEVLVQRFNDVSQLHKHLPHGVKTRLSSH